MLATYALLQNAKFNFVLLITLEMMSIKMLTYKIWKSVPPINEDFFARFLTRLNVLVCAFFAIVAIMANASQVMRDQYLLMDNAELNNADAKDDDDDVNYELTKNLAIFTGICVALMVTFQSLSNYDQSDQIVMVRNWSNFTAKSPTLTFLDEKSPFW